MNQMMLDALREAERLTSRPPYIPRGACEDLQTDESPQLFISGPAGTGKSRAAFEKMYHLAQTYKGFRGLIARKTRASLTETGLVTFERDVLGLDHPLVLDGPQRNWRNSYKLPNGSEIVIGGMDNVSRILSSEYDMAYFQQAEEITEDEAEITTTRLRNGAMPYQQLMGDVNPSYPRHWIKQRCDQGGAVMLESRHQDNPVLWDAENGVWTEAGMKYIAVLDRLTGARKQRLRFGRWVQAEGVVHEGWDANIHIIDRFEIPADWRRFRVVDFGYVHPFVCYDDQTEVLTEHGWMLFGDVPHDSAIATVNMTTKRLEFQKPTSRIKQHYEGRMVLGTGGTKLGVNFCVTPNHQMVLEERRSGNWGKFRADKMPRWRGIPTGWLPAFSSGPAIFSVPHSSGRGRLPDVDLLDFASFLGWWIGDGSLLKSNAGHFVRIAQKVDRARLEESLNALGWNWRSAEGKNGVWDYRIQSKDLYLLLEPFRDKRIPEWAFTWSTPALETLLDGLIASDGSDRANATLGYYTTSQGLADDVQRLAALLGIPSVIGKQKGTGFNGPTMCFVVRLHKPKRAIVAKLRLENIRYNGNIYCFEVPNGTLVVRRDNRPMISGNCQWWAIDGDGRMYRYREIHMTKRTVKAHSAQINALSEGERIEATICDHDAEDRATLAENGIYSIAARKGVSVGIQAVADRLQKQGDGKPRIYFLRDSLVEIDQEQADAKRPLCTEHEFDGYVWHDKASKEAPVKVNDDGMDAMRYAVMALDAPMVAEQEIVIVDEMSMISPY